MKELKTFIDRLARIGINVELLANYPWIYLDRVNSKKVTERFRAEHGFTVAFLNKGLDFTDTAEIFKVIRRYVTIALIK